MKSLTTPIVKFNDIYFKYHSTQNWILRKFSLNIDYGSFLILVGPTGSGKSTILKLLRGFNKYYGGVLKGNIVVKNKDYNLLGFNEISRLGIGWVGQDPNLSLHQLSVRDEILSSPVYFNLPWEDCVLICEKVFKELNLKKLSNNSPNSLSEGEKQRVAIGAAISLPINSSEDRHRIILLDEPDSFLDTQGKRNLIEILKQLKKNNTIIIATHHFENFLDLSDKITLINNGEIIISGKPEKVLNGHEIRNIIGYPEYLELAAFLKKKRIIDMIPLNKNQFIKALSFTQDLRFRKNIPKNKNYLSCIDYKNISFKYNDDLILSNIITEIDKGSITTIIGNNGSGKTTLAKLTIGLFKKYEGKIAINGKDINLYPKKYLSSLISYISQIPSDMFLKLKVIDECKLKPKKNNKINYKEIALKALKILNISNLAQQPVDSLSGGQSRLLSIAASVLIQDPEIIILDEPEYGIDNNTRRQLFEIISDFKKKKKTVLIITHNLDSALLSDFVIIMNKGKILKKGPPIKIFKDKKSIVKIGLDIPFLYPIYKWLWSKGYDIDNYNSFFEIFKKEINELFK